MRSYPFIQNLFGGVLAKSKAIQGRFYICPRMGQELNSDELEKLITDSVIPERVAKKAPLSLLMPPVSYGTYTDKNGEWDEYRFIMFFLNTSFYTATNQTKNPNQNTRTSTHSIVEDWHDMKRVAVSFINVLDRVQRTLGLINKSFRLDTQRDRIITPVSLIGTDRYSGVRLDFAGSIFIGCGIEDYTEEDIGAITINQDDTHPEHQQ